MSKESSFVPIDDANRENIRFALDLPAHLDRSNIHVNPDRLQGFMKLGGINHLRVESYEEDRISESPTIVGFDAQGSGLAGKMGSTTKEPELDTNLNHYSNSCSPVVDVIVKVDTKKLSEKMTADLRSYKGWGKELDSSIKNGIRDSGNKTLLLYNLRHDALNLGIHALFQMKERYLLGGNLLESAAFYSEMSIVFAALYQAGNLIPNAKKHRLSAFLGPQIDRALVLDFRSRLQKVIKGTDEK